MAAASNPARSTAKPTVAILGASEDRTKFGNKSVRAHLRQGYDVYPVNPKAESIEGLKAYPRLADVPVALDRVSVYLPPAIGLKVLDEVAAKGCKELFLNPGSDSPEVIDKARELGLEPIVACSIVDLGASPSEFGA
jgi:predicted CoA-binding protein